jgi:ribosomal protein L19E
MHLTNALRQMHDKQDIQAQTYRTTFRELMGTNTAQTYWTILDELIGGK